jgi:hypothetical protein
MKTTISTAFIHNATASLWIKRKTVSIQPSFQIFKKLVHRNLHSRSLSYLFVSIAFESVVHCFHRQRLRLLSFISISYPSHHPEKRHA